MAESAGRASGSIIRKNSMLCPDLDSVVVSVLVWVWGGFGDAPEGHRILEAFLLVGHKSSSSEKQFGSWHHL